MNLRHTFLLLALLLGAMSVHAESAERLQSFVCEGKKKLTEAEAEQVLQGVQKRYEKLSTLSANFIQNSYLASLDLSESSFGKVWLSKPGKMKWHYTDPEEQVFLVHGQTLWFYQVADNQVVVDDFTKALISDLPVSFLMGIGNLGHDFKVAEGCKTSDGYVLDLLPNQGDSESQRDNELKGFRMLVNMSSSLPMGAEVTDVSGNRTSIVFSDEKAELPIESSVFAENFPKGVDVNDRREQKL